MTIKPERSANRKAAAVAYENFLYALGYDVEEIPAMCSGPSGKNTALRAADAMIEFLSKGQEYVDFTVFPIEDTNPGMVTVTHIQFASMCAHHCLPYTGYAHVGYLPALRVCGISKIVRIVDHYAHRFSIQEDLTSKIATFLMEQLMPVGVGVMIEAEHMCMSLRGVERPGHITVTSLFRGCFDEDVAIRNEFMSLVHQSSLRR